MHVDPETIELTDMAIKMGFTKETMAAACQVMADRIDSIILARMLAKDRRDCPNTAPPRTEDTNYKGD